MDSVNKRFIIQTLNVFKGNDMFICFFFVSKESMSKTFCVIQIHVIGNKHHRGFKWREA